MAKEKKIATNIFTGGVDTVTADELLPNNSVRYSLNCEYLSTADGQVGVIRNIKGNVLIQVDLPSGTNKTIGYATDKKNHKFYYFLYNSNGYHTIYEFDSITRSVYPILQSTTDSGGYDILRFNPKYRINHANVVNGKLYWVDGLNPARSLNISRIKDKSFFGGVISEDYITANKKAPIYSPKAEYFTDPTKKFNTLYGRLMRFAVRYIYIDSEQSNWSDYSKVPLPLKESFTGLKYIPTDNNGVKIQVETGNREVAKIEIACQFNSEPWVSIATLDKKSLSITDNGLYTYNFYNDGSYVSINAEKIIRPYNYLPDNPYCQDFLDNVIGYANFNEGFEVVPIDVSKSVRYDDLGIEDGVENQYNEPQFIADNQAGSDYWLGNEVTRLDGSKPPNSTKGRANVWKITIGTDVKKGNIFTLQLYENGTGQSYTVQYTATLTDTAQTVANQIRTKIIETGGVLKYAEGIGDVDIYSTSVDGSGNVSFSFIYTFFGKKSRPDYPNLSSSVTPVQFSTLKDTGQSLNNIKLGSTVKYGLVYYNDNKKSATYTNDALITNFSSVNTLGGIKHPVVTLTINHKAPKWAKYYEVVRTSDLTSSFYLQMLIQEVNEVQETESEGEYLDLLVGSLFTYQRIHENTILQYEFQKGDRIRLIGKTSDDSYYPDYETEILSYKTFTEETINNTIVINGTSDVVVTGAINEGNIGKYIRINGHERQISAVTGSGYTLSSPIGKSDDPETIASFQIVDSRGTVRIRKPATDIVTIEDLSVVEFYKPNLGGDITSKRFFGFGYKFPIINPGTDNALHSAPKQSQTETLPAIVEIDNGTNYVRNRELPTTNAKPAQTAIWPIEDQNYSDFYVSSLNDNGKDNAEDEGQGVVHFGSRVRYSNNFIQDTKINGLNDFDNTDREDYYDQYGDIKRIFFKGNRLYVFKEQKDAIVPVNQSIIRQADGTPIVGLSDKRLNQIQYYDEEGGIGNNPESVAEIGNWLYHVMPERGSVARIGGSGVELISKLYNVNNRVKELLRNASKYGSEIPGQVDPRTGKYIFSISGFNQSIFKDDLTEGQWVLDEVTEEITGIAITTLPSHGTLSFDGLEITYQPNTGYVGNDQYSYSIVTPSGTKPPHNVCIEVVEQSNRLTGWRPKESTYFCVLDNEDLNNGFKGWTTLEEYYLDDNTTTGNEKANSEGDSDYAAPIKDETACPLVTPDPNPDPFTFTSVTDATLNGIYVSNSITIAGTNVPSDISVVSGEYSINGGAFTSTPGTISLGDTLRLRRAASASYLTTVTVTVTVGNYSTTFSITTIVEPPYPFKWIAKTSTQYCETEIVEQDVFTGFASPLSANIYGNELIYADADLGGYIRFNPTTITSGADAANHATALANRPSFALISPVLPNRLYLNTFGNGGIRKIDLTTNTDIGVISYGMDGSFTRGNMYYVEPLNEIWGLGQSFVRFKADTEEISTSPEPSFSVTGSSGVFVHNNKIYVIVDNAFNEIRVYNTSLTLISTITGICQNTNVIGQYTIRGIYVDSTNDKIYVGEVSSTGGLVIIDGTSDTIVGRVAIDKESYSYCAPQTIALHPLRNVVYVGGALYTVTSDQHPRLWAFDIATQTITQTLSPILTNGTVNDIVYLPSNNSVYISSAGRVPESSPNTGSGSDGVLIKYN